MTKKEMHIKALSKGIDSQTIKGSMTVILLGHAVDMMMELQDAHEAELKAKEEKHGDELQALLNDMGRAISKLSGELKAKDEELGVAKKVAQDAYTLGASQAAEMDRFWAEFGLLDKNISVDDAVLGRR